MSQVSSYYARVLNLLEAHKNPEKQSHELKRSWDRTLVSLLVTLVWLPGMAFGESTSRPRQLLLAAAIATLLGSFAYRRLLKAHPDQVVLLIYTFLIVDPVLILGTLAEDPKTFAFFNPLLLFMVVGTGIRYGIQTMYLAWSSTVIASLLLLTSQFWRDNVELTLGFVLILISIPTLFGSLIRRVHNVRAIEEDRARLLAMNEVFLARSAFLGKVSHELRSPLQGIVSALDVLSLRHGTRRSDDDELIGRIRRSSLLLNTHLRDLLTLARGEAGRLEVRPEPFEACALVDSVAAAAGQLATAKHLELVVDVPSEAVFVIADGARIDQILTNLVINSIRYTDAGQVRLSMRPYDASTRLLRFAVADTGPGIPEDMLPNLLVPDRVITGAERRGEGSGMGLAIVRTLVDHLGGRIEVASRLGKGTTFTLEIPAEPVPDVGVHGESGSSTGRVLIVDDREDVLDALVSVVDELGFECDRASSAGVGANLLASRMYDVVLLDLEMPIKGGAALAAETRNGNGPNRATRFVGMSASALPQDTGLHFDACLSKPIDHAALRQVLLNVDASARPSQPGLWSEAD